MRYWTNKVGIKSYLLVLLIIVGCSTSAVRKNDPLDRKVDVNRLWKEFSGAKKSRKVVLLDEIYKLSSGKTAIILIAAMRDKSKKVRTKALEYFERYRKFTFDDLDRSYFAHLDKWFLESPEVILSQMGYQKKYDEFIDKLELSGRRIQYYKKNPLYFLIKAKRIRPILKGYIRGKVKPITAFWACWVAGEMQYDAAIPYLVKIIRKKHKLTTGLDVRCAAIHALSKFESRKWNKLFLQLFRSRNPYVQEVSVTAIGTLRDYRLSSAFMELIQANTKTMSTSLRLGLIWAVGNMYIKSLRGTILEQGLDEKSEWIRVQQIWALYRLGTKKTPHLVVKSLYDKSDAVRNVALLVIQNVNDSSVAPDILKLLKDKSPDIRLIAAQLLGDWDIKKADTRIIPLLKDKDGRVQLAAVVALGKLRSKNAISPLIGLLQDRRNSERLKIIVVKTVLAIGHREAYSGMKDFYLEQVFNPSVNKDASSAKSSKSPSESSGPDSASPSNRGSDPDKSNTKKKKEILPPFRTVIEKLADKDQCVKLLSHKNDKVKLEALAAIPAFKEKITDFKFLMKMILGSSNEIKTEIIRVMGEVNYKDKEDIEILIALLPNEKVDRKIRIQVIYTLGRLQNPQGKAAILRQVNLLDEDFKIAALEALGYYGDDSSIETIEESLTYSKKESEQLVSIFSLAMLNKTEQKYQKIVLKLAKNPAKKLLHFLEEYFKRMPKATQTKLYKKIIRGLNSKEIKLIKDLFYPPKNDEENSPP